MPDIDFDVKVAGGMCDAHDVAVPGPAASVCHRTGDPRSGTDGDGAEHPDRGVAPEWG